MAVGGILAAGVAEIALRILPIPGVTYHTFYYDELTGMRFYPKSALIYRSDRSEEVRRRVNAWGYLDRDHTIEKPDGVTRIGFFGDSFTEARQVPLADTFHNLIEAELNSRSGSARFEAIAISMMGYSTLQSYLESHRWVELLDIDKVVYVFCENDPANHIPAINRIDAVPYPFLTGDSLKIDRSFHTRYQHKTRWPHRSWQYAKSHSLVFSVLETRLKFLRMYGAKRHVTDAERTMAAPTTVAATPEIYSPPSVWPDSLRTLGVRLTERVILEWQRDVQSQGRDFQIVYIPRPSEIENPSGDSDSWLAWLVGLCDANGIRLVDPSIAFGHAASGGAELFYDHLTVSGHRLLAAEFVSSYVDTER